ncbi:phosphate uptake regulator, PhoU [Thermoproteus uzoniensis 768-20]|uniref:Phosphate uptake regulator, PhoU n=1 Tax=Thermoproteus uzoniensis (strain 768-20) TaxID=999630 RepID=F2L3C9_THEU7|nr:phosphate uptake regulator PhoU [Thermoproteus uzoniensis]AEA11988.1 phosphate uptake regulator, PhoU [Thermoproteus uzoniensis 768-20]
MEGEVRRVQLTGGATLIVSLPKEWARRTNLSPGDEVLIVPQPDNTLVLIPRKLGRRTSLSVELYVDEKTSVEELEKIFMSIYIAGAEVITIRFAPGATQYRKYLKDFVRRRVIDMEITEESSDKLVVQAMVAATELAIGDVVLKMLKLADNMLLDLVKGLETDNMELLRDVTERDDEVDRLYWLVERQLKRAAMSRYIMLELKVEDPRDLVEYTIIAKSIERIADHICKISYINQEEKVDLRVVRPILERAVEHMGALMDFFGGNVDDMKLAALYRELTDWSLKMRKEVVLSDPATSLARDSAVRINEYISDILESLLHIRLKNFQRLGAEARQQ